MTMNSRPAGALAVLAVACGGDTGEQRVRFPVEVRGLSPTVDREGVPVQLDSARLSADALSFYDGDPLFSWSRWFVGVAQAHPGHYTPGDALAELNGPIDADLLAGMTVWGQAEGVSGDYRSAEIDGVRLSLSGQAGDRPFSTEVEVRFPIAGLSVRPPGPAAPQAVRLIVDLDALFSSLRFEAEGDPLALGTRAHNGLFRAAATTAIYQVHLERR